LAGACLLPPLANPIQPPFDLRQYRLGPPQHDIDPQGFQFMAHDIHLRIARLSRSLGTFHMLIDSMTSRFRSCPARKLI
jgi:hypothetical protein